MPEQPYTVVLFDLDGTIIDSAPGITATISSTLTQMGVAVPGDDELRGWVGPPLLESFHERGGLTMADALRAVEIYRSEYMSGGAFNASVFPGIPEALQTVSRSRLPLSLATSKPEGPATMVLTHFQLAHHFDELTGADDDTSRSEKAEVVAEALRRLAARGADISRPVLIGDRHHDVAGAAVHGIPTIYASWGYGGPGEEEGAVAIADTAEDLSLLLGLRRAGE